MHSAEIHLQSRVSNVPHAISEYSSARLLGLDPLICFEVELSPGRQVVKRSGTLLVAHTAGSRSETRSSYTQTWAP